MLNPEGGVALGAVGVYCGSSSGTHPDYVETARALGVVLAQRGITLVYGGGSVGLMGAVANAALNAGGLVHGVITEALVSAEVSHRNLTTLEIVDSMHARKYRMAELVDGFIALPGGYGTLDELFEVLTWTQLGIHSKPAVLVNVRGYFDGVLHQTRHAVNEGFMKQAHAEVLRSAATPHEAIELLAMPVAPPVPKWVDT